MWPWALRTMRHMVGASVVALCFGLSAFPAAAAQSCGPHPAAVKLQVDAPQPAIDNSLPQPELQRLAQDRAKQDHQGRVLGLYTAQMMAKTRTKFDGLPSGRDVCLRVTEVEVQFSILDRRIYIVNEWRTGTCPYTAILAHERKHQATDERVLRDKTPILKRRIADALSRASTQPIAASQIESTKQRLAGIVQAEMDKMVREIEQSATAAQRAVDAGLEYKRVADSCAQFRRPA